jgi:hypothetical protein
MFKKIALAALFIAPASAMAATDTLTFDIEASVPTARQYVKFQDVNFGGSQQEMVWDRSTEQLQNISTTVLARNTEGNITAYLQDTAELAHDSEPDNNIPLNVTLQGTALPVGSVAAVEVVSSTDAATEKNLNLVVSPNTSTYAGGDYTGTVTMIFDHGI